MSQVPLASPARTGALFVLLLCSATVGLSQEPFPIEGRLPPGVAGTDPGGLEVHALVATDLQGQLPEPVATATVEDGAFRLLLPESVDPALLEPEIFDCDRELTLPSLFLPYLTVVRDGEPVGRLVRSDVPPELWGFGGPPRNASWVYTTDEATVSESCPPESFDLVITPGWNRFVVLASQEGVTITTDDPPATFRWIFVSDEEPDEESTEP